MSRHQLGLILIAAVVACKHPGASVDCGFEPDRAGGPPALELTVVDPERSEMARGWFLMAQNTDDASWVTAINGCAEHVWWRPAQDPDAMVVRAHPSRNGTRVLSAEHNREHTEDLGRLYEFDIERDVIVSETRMVEAHHDFAEFGDGQVAWISWQYLENLWFPNLDANVVTDAIRTAPLGTADETDNQLFSLYDDSGLDPWWSCPHMNPTDLFPGYAEWSHSNSLIYEPVADRFYLNARHWDTLLAIDRTGALQWMMGGPASDFAVTPGSTLPVHAHLSEVWDGGLLAFDNRNHTGAGSSRVVELAWDEDARTVEEVWSYEDGTMVGFLGDAKRLPGGNVLIVWATDGRITEVTREGEVVWEAVSEERLARGDFVEHWP